jgi:MFS family permease
MGAGTALIGLLPNFATIGIAAPILLVSLRLLQGIGIGGEWGGALLLAYENAPESRRAFYGSIPQIGVTLGMLLASVSVALVSLLPADDFQRWGWRLPFLGSVVLIAVGLWMRQGIDETPEFKAVVLAGKTLPSPFIFTMRHHWREVLIACGAKFVDTAPFYICTVFIISYATKVLGAEQFDALRAVSISALLASFMLPTVGWFADRLGRRRVFLCGCLLMMIVAAPYFWVLQSGTPWALIAGTALVMVLVWPLATALLGTVTAELFATEVRYTGITLGYQIGAALVGGTAPLLATWLLKMDGNRWRLIALFLAFAGAVSALAIVVGARRARSSMATSR